MWKCNNCGGEIKLITEKVIFDRIKKDKELEEFQSLSKSFFICDCPKTSILKEKIENIAYWED